MNAVAVPGKGCILALLKTCRQVYIEARMLPFAVNEVRCNQRPHAEIWAEDHPVQAQAVTIIRHYCKVFWSFPYPLTAWSVFKGYKNLQHLQIDTTTSPVDRGKVEEDVQAVMRSICPSAKVSFLYRYPRQQR